MYLCKGYNNLLSVWDPLLYCTTFIVIVSFVNRNLFIFKHPWKRIYPLDEIHTDINGYILQRRLHDVGS